MNRFKNDYLKLRITKPDPTNEPKKSEETKALDATEIMDKA